jgi:zinc/manganese transport system permease protein
VLKREIIFVDISLAQFAALGATIAHCCFASSGHHGHHHGGLMWQEYLFAFLMVVVMAVFYSVVKRCIKEISIEAVIGVTYAVGFAAVLFISGVFSSEHGHMREMLFGDFFALSEWSDLTACFIVLGAALLLCLLFSKPLHRISAQYTGRERQGAGDILWDILFYSIMGIVITISVPIIGVVLIFCYLVIPAAMAALFTQKGWLQLVIIVGCVAVSSAAGLAFSVTETGSSFSMGPPVGACMGLLLVIAAIGKRAFSGGAGRST